MGRGRRTTVRERHGAPPGGQRILGRTGDPGSLEGQGFIPEPVENSRVPRSDRVAHARPATPSGRQWSASRSRSWWVSTRPGSFTVAVGVAARVPSPRAARRVPLWPCDAGGSSVSIRGTCAPRGASRDRGAGTVARRDGRDRSRLRASGSLSPTVILRLLQRTQGWPVAVYLGALATRLGQSPSSSPIASYGALPTTSATTSSNPSICTMLCTCLRSAS